MGNSLLCATQGVVGEDEEKLDGLLDQSVPCPSSPNDKLVGDSLEKRGGETLLGFWPVRYDGDILLVGTFAHSHTQPEPIRKLRVELGDILPRAETWPAVSKVLKKILASNHAALEEIELMEPIGFLQGLTFPPLINLRTMTLTLTLDFGLGRKSTVLEWLQKGLLFPPGFQFSQQCPNVTDISVRVIVQNEGNGNIDLDLWEAPFASTGVSTSVLRVKYNDSDLGLDTRQLCRCFPNAQIEKI